MNENYGYPADTPQKTAIWQNLKWLADIFPPPPADALCQNQDTPIEIMKKMCYNNQVKYLTMNGGQACR